MNIAIVDARSTDGAAITELLAELDRYYGDTQGELPPFEKRLAVVQEMLFATQPAAHMLLAYGDDTLLGLASYSFLWPGPRLQKVLFAKELYVCTRARQTGIGRRLTQAVLQKARDAGCGRVEWMAFRQHEDTLRFYEHLGAPVLVDKVCYRIEL